MVCQCNASITFAGSVLKCLIPEYSCPFFFSYAVGFGICRHIHRYLLPVNTKPGTELTHKAGIPPALLASYTMLHMDYPDIKIKLLLQFPQNQKEADRICSSRHTHNYGFMRSYYVICPAKFANLLYHYFSQIPSTTMVISSLA